MESGRQLRPQPWFRHFDDIQGGPALGRLQEPAGSAVDVEDLPLPVDDDAGCGFDLFEDRLGDLQRDRGFDPPDSSGAEPVRRRVG